MSEATISVLIAAGILIVLAFFVPCMELLARLLRSNGEKRTVPSSERTGQVYERDIA